MGTIQKRQKGSMARRKKIDEKFEQLGEVCAEADYRWELVEDAVKNVNFQKDKEAALD